MPHNEQFRNVDVHEELLRATFHRGLLNQKIKEVTIGQAFSCLGWRGHEIFAEFVWGNLLENICMENYEDGGMALRWILERCCPKPYSGISGANLTAICEAIV
jgi:hypothetical protein